MIEDEIFRRRNIDFDSLEGLGFRQEGDVYLASFSFSEGMYLRLRIFSDGIVRGQIFDRDFEEEYTLFRNEEAEGKFVTGVRLAYEDFLRSIAEKISVNTLYAGAQANRISARIKEVYHVEPEFMWERFPHYGVYRHPDSEKWFGIIMNIDRKKVDPLLHGECEVMNLKTDDLTPKCLEKGAYLSYHMNHKSWISVILDDRIEDEKIWEMIEISYGNVSKKKEKGRKKKER